MRLHRLSVGVIHPPAQCTQDERHCKYPERTKHGTSPLQAVLLRIAPRLCQVVSKGIGLPEHGCYDGGTWGSFGSVLPKAGQLIRGSAKSGAGFLCRWGGCPLQMGHFLRINHQIHRSRRSARSGACGNRAATTTSAMMISHNVYYVKLRLM